MTGQPSLLSAFWASFRAGGCLMGPLFLTAFLIWGSYLTLFLRLRTALRGGDAEDLALGQRLDGGRESRAVCDWLATLPGAVPRMTRHVLVRMRWGLSFRDACAQCRFQELDPYNYAMVWLGALIVAAPLLGLLGTVLGMIDTFNAVALRTEEAAHLVSSGISEALLTTEVGLLAALPGTFGLAHLFRLYKHLANRLDHCESHLALALEHRAPGDTPGGLADAQGSAS